MRLRRYKGDGKGERVIYPPFSTTRYARAVKQSASGTFTMIEHGSGSAYASYWVPTRALKVR